MPLLRKKQHIQRKPLAAQEPVKETLTDTYHSINSKVPDMFAGEYLHFNCDRDESYASWLLECESTFEPIISRESCIVPISVELQNATDILNSEAIPSDYVCEKTYNEEEEEELVIL